MKTYTRNGDEGDTSGPGGERTRKTDPRIEAIGTLDELNTHVGCCIKAAGKHAEVGEVLKAIQWDLFVLGAMLADAGASLDASAVTRLERQIDTATASLPELTDFILPGG